LVNIKFGKILESIEDQVPLTLLCIPTLLQISVRFTFGKRLFTREIRILDA
jgi:hypothetical protein